jgi:hypothetical protein
LTGLGSLINRPEKRHRTACPEAQAGHTDRGTVFLHPKKGTPQWDFKTSPLPPSSGASTNSSPTSGSKSWASRIGWLNSGSNQETETYKWLGNVPKFREWVNGRAAGHPKVETYSIRNKLWEQTLEFGIDDLRRDKTGQIMIRIGELAQAGAAFWEDLLTTLINNGNTSGFTAYDGELFFDTDHPVKESTTGSTTAKNLVSSSTEVPRWT